MRLVLIGLPGTDKDTQTAILSEKFGAPHTFIGDLFHTNIGKSTPLGIEAKSYIDAGNLVLDGVIVHVVESRLNEDDTAKGFLLDGFSYIVGQIGELKCLLSSLGTGLDAVVQSDVFEDVAARRILARGHADDTEEVIRSRTHVYANEAVPLLDYYSEKIIKIAVEGSVEGINKRTMAELEKLS